MAENVITLTDSNFEEEVLKSKVPVLIDFWAEWCGPCKMIAPSIKEIATEFKGKVKVGKLDVDSNQETTAKYRILNIPTLLYFKEGKVIEQILGAVPKKRIVSTLESIL
ncbi:thioredoxin [candidate division KSB1 bacterium]